jgi:hypothetical protein
MTNEELLNSITTLDSLRREQIVKRGDDPDDGNKYRLYDPATVEQIKRAESERGRPYSPLFREFLALHNGWFRFWPSWSLVGTRGDDNSRAYAHIDEALSELRLVVTPEDIKALPQLEKENPARVMITNHPIIGTDFNGNFLLLDQNRLGDDGEPEVAWVIYLNHVERRWKNFGELLQNAITSTRLKLQS